MVMRGERVAGARRLTVPGVLGMRRRRECREGFMYLVSLGTVCHWHVVFTECGDA
jgi:hypothetical protein